MGIINSANDLTAAAIWAYVPVVGDPANSASQKLRGVTDNQSVLTRPAFDNARFSMTASQTTDIIPATGETDSGMIWADTVIGATTDILRVSADSGTTYTTIFNVNQATGSNDIGDTLGNYNHILNIGNSTGRYRIVTDATAGTRQFNRAITTLS